MKHSSFPKIELHVHLEATVHPKALFEMAHRNGFALPTQNEAELAQLYRVGAENLIRRRHATSLYSWMRPASRSDLRSRSGLGSAIGGGTGDIVSGGAWWSERCGRWQL